MFCCCESPEEIVEHDPLITTQNKPQDQPNTVCITSNPPPSPAIIDSLRKEIEELKQSLADMEETSHALEAELEQQVTELQKGKTTLEIENETLLVRVRELEASEETLRSQRDKLVERLALSDTQLKQPLAQQQPSS